MASRNVRVSLVERLHTATHVPQSCIGVALSKYSPYPYHHSIMERSRNIFLKISSASRNVITAANTYADHKGLACIQRSHFQLETDMRRISAACNTLAGILGGSCLPDEPEIDVRLQDWLISDEPRVCLDTLTGMEKLLQNDMPSWKNMFMRGFGVTPTQDRIQEAADLLGSCKDCFHFLFTTQTL